MHFNISVRTEKLVIGSCVSSEATCAIHSYWSTGLQTLIYCFAALTSDHCCHSIAISDQSVAAAYARCIGPFVNCPFVNCHKNKSDNLESSYKTTQASVICRLLGVVSTQHVRSTQAKTCSDVVRVCRPEIMCLVVCLNLLSG